MKPMTRVERLDEARAISLWQMFASAIPLGLKRYETRGWTTRYRGLIYIHAAKRWTQDSKIQQASFFYHLRTAFGPDDSRVKQFEVDPPLGCIVAVADLVECWPTNDIPGHVSGVGQLEGLFGDFRNGRYAWQLENVVALPQPVKCDGKQGLWTPPAGVIDEVRIQMGGVA